MIMRDPVGDFFDGFKERVHEPFTRNPTLEAIPSSPLLPG
jgi:hypothetical protein